MAGRRPLTGKEERQLLRVVRKLDAQERLLCTMQWQTGFRCGEILSMKLSSVYHGDRIVEQVGVPPRNLKGRYGSTRWIEVLPELSRALERYRSTLRGAEKLTPDRPLFLSRERNADGSARAWSYESARRIMLRVFAAAGITGPRLGTHSYRKTWAKHVFENSNLQVLKLALGHSCVSITQKYLEEDADAVAAAIRGCDFTRKPRAARLPVERPELAPVVPMSSAA